MLVSLGLLMACGLVAAIPLGLHTAGLLSREALDWLVPILTLGVFFIGLFVGLVWLNRLDPKPSATPDPPSESPEPPTRLSRHLVERAGRDASSEGRQLRLAEFAEPRLEYARAASRSVTGSVDLIAFGSVLGPLGIGLVVFTVRQAMGLEKDEPGILALGWLMFVAGTSVLAALRLRRGRRRRALSDALSLLAGDFSGRKLEKFGEALDWLNENWAAPSGHEDLFAGPLHRAVSGILAGYPVLVDVEPDGYSSEDSTYDPYVIVYVTAQLPAPTPAIQARAERATAAFLAIGFRMEAYVDAGLLARATPERVKDLRRHFGDLSELRAVASELVAFAKACSAPPALPDPAARSRLEAALAVS
jgi:hypothetical protein